jgi:hypothetical protein
MRQSPAAGRSTSSIRRVGPVVVERSVVVVVVMSE